MDERHLSIDRSHAVIEALRTRLNKLAGRSRLTSRRVIRISQRLDRMLMKHCRDIYQAK